MNVWCSNQIQLPACWCSHLQLLKGLAMNSPQLYPLMAKFPWTNWNCLIIEAMNHLFPCSPLPSGGKDLSQWLTSMRSKMSTPSVELNPLFWPICVSELCLDQTKLSFQLRPRYCLVLNPVCYPVSFSLLWAHPQYIHLTRISFWVLLPI